MEETKELTIEEKFNLVFSVGEECVTEAELRNLIAKKPNFILYDGYASSSLIRVSFIYEQI
jgi:tyrosyl-tRNA synthetase